jgi:hypothetical protein
MSNDDQVDALFEQLGDDDVLELFADDIEPRRVSVHSVSPRRSSVLVDMDAPVRELMDADVPLRARIARLDDGPLVCVSFDRADRALARLHVSPPDTHDRRDNARIEAPSEADASLLELDEDRDEDERIRYATDVLDIGMGGLGVALPPDCRLKPDQHVEIDLDVGPDWNLTCTGRLVYIEPLDDRDQLRAGVEFLQLSEEWRQSMFRLLSGEDS